MTKIRVSLLAPALALLLLSGCTEDEPKPRFADPTSDAPTSTEPSPTETTTVAPEDETPKQFIRRWFAESYRAQRTGETATYRSMTRGCRSCNRVATSIEEVYGAGGYIRPSGYEITKLESQGQDATSATYELGYTGKPTRFVESEGAEVNTLSGGRDVLRVYLSRSEGAWLVVEFTTIGDG